MSSSKSNTKRTRSSTGSLKQGTLAFTAKRTGSNTSSTPKAKKPATRTKSAPAPVQVEAIEAIDSSSSSSSSISSISSSSGSEELERIESDEYVPTRSWSDLKKKTSKAVSKGKAPLRSRVNAGGSGIDLRADNPGKWRKHYGEAREKTGNLETSEFTPFLLSESRRQASFYYVVYCDFLYMQRD